MRCLLVLNGQAPERGQLRRFARAADLVIVTDGAINKIPGEVDVDVVIGDLDSIAEGATDRDVRVIHNPDQDTTDLEKALAYITFSAEATVLVVLGWKGGRTDHFLSVLFALSTSVPETRLLLHHEGETLLRLTPRHPVECEVQVGCPISVLPLTGCCEGVVSEGLRWPLNEERLEPGGFASQSNEAASDRVRVRCTGGIAWVVINGPECV